MCTYHCTMAGMDKFCLNITKYLFVLGDWCINWDTARTPDAYPCLRDVQTSHFCFQFTQFQGMLKNAKLIWIDSLFACDHEMDAIHVKFETPQYQTLSPVPLNCTMSHKSWPPTVLPGATFHLASRRYMDLNFKGSYVYVA